MKMLEALLSLKSLPLILMALAAICLAGCLPPWKTAQPISTENKLPEHDSWCYQSLGYADCYAHPQNRPASNLINVDPQSRYPLTPQEYGKAVAADGQ